MTQLALTVNGKAVSAEVEPRTHLADFLRETLLLTGTHLGCEHGVCGACTVLLDDEPVRSCLTFAALCDGAAVRSVEGLEGDAVMVALRAAFSAEHALQCGYCTPGMLVTARDIVLRLPDADDDRIRLELAGNLCRCTGYNGIVKAIRRVLDAAIEVQRCANRPSVPVARPVEVRPTAPMVTKPAVPVDVSPAFAATARSPAPVTARPSVPDTGRPTVATTARSPVPNEAAAEPARSSAPPGSQRLREQLRIGVPADTVWAAIQDPGLVAACVPGARLLSVEGNRIAGEMLASLGPIQARFAGTADLAFDPVTHGGRLAGEGQDAAGVTRLSGEAIFAVVPDGPHAAVITLDIAYALRGKLAQFGRAPVVAVFAAEIAATVARNLDSRLRGAALPEPSARLSGGRLFMRVLWRALRRWVKRPDA